MKDTHPEAITIVLDGEEKTLKLGPAAFRLAELKHKIRFTVEELSSPTLSSLARFAYVACLVDDPKLKEEDFMVKMANSDEGAILSAVGQALKRMTSGLSALDGAEGNGGKEG